jgi:hypothetical protein
MLTTMIIVAASVLVLGVGRTARGIVADIDAALRG